MNILWKSVLRKVLVFLYCPLFALLRKQLGVALASSWLTKSADFVSYPS